MPIRPDACNDFFPPQPEVRAGQLAPGGGPRTVKAQEKAQEKAREKAQEMSAVAVRPGGQVERYSPIRAYEIAHGRYAR
jgi:hypothetical protein